MEKADKQQIYSKLCSNLSTFLPVILVLVLLSFYFYFSISKSFPFLLTIPIALLSTMFLVTMKKKKGSQQKNLIQDEMQKEGLQHLLDVTQTEINQQSETVESHELQAEAQLDYSFPSDSESSNVSVMDKAFELNVQEHEPQADWQLDSSLPSDSESFEIDHKGNVGSSDNLASDNDDDDDDDDSDDDDDDEEEEEDSLIEINLPNSNFSGLTVEPKQKLDSKLPDFLPESIFKQQGLMELLAEINEMNEDENLIEIDISMGSTNGQDFELKQELAYLGDQCVLGD